MNVRLTLDWAVLAVSFYNTISLLWLGVMVVLIGNRRSPGTWLTASGMLLGALFFTSHSAILGRGITDTGFGMNFWWAVSWIPAITAPMAWYGAMLWHTGFRFQRGYPHNIWLVIIAGMVVVILFLLIFANPLPSYHYVAGRTINVTPSLGEIPLLIVFYLAYSILSYLLPLDLLRRNPHTSNPLLDHSRDLARPWLIAASLAMLLAGGMLTWTALWALSSPFPSLMDAGIQENAKTFDLVVESLVALAITLLGRAVVAYEVFTGRPLPRDRFFYQWRSAVVLAGGFGLIASGAMVVNLRPISTLLLSAILMALFYALFAWRSYAEREDFMARLRPFVASQNLYGQLIDPTAASDHSAGPLFETLCHEILGVKQAVLLPLGPLATLVGPPLVYPEDERIAGLPSPIPPASLGNEKNPAKLQYTKEREDPHPTLSQGRGSQDQKNLHRKDTKKGKSKEENAVFRNKIDFSSFFSSSLRSLRLCGANSDPSCNTLQGEREYPSRSWSDCFTPGMRYLAIAEGDLNWAVPLWSERGLGGVLFLGSKETSNPFTEEEIELAQAGGERLLDMLAGSEIARLSLELLRQRVTQARVLEGQGRRVLHDEVLPELHTAILYLSGAACNDPNVKEVVDTLSAAHHRISDLLRETAAGVPARLAQSGLIAALRSLLDGDLAGEFQRVIWQIDPAAAEKVCQAPTSVTEVVYFAARELVRNAARYGRGNQPRPLRLAISLETAGERLRLGVADDGVGLSDQPSPVGAGNGLRIHSAMLAAVGASLEISSQPEGGTRGVILF
jgi:signal transduction histidine kinase